MSRIYFGASFVWGKKELERYVADLRGTSAFSDYFKAKIRYIVAEVPGEGDAQKVGIAFELHNPAPHFGLLAVLFLAAMGLFGLSGGWFWIPSFFVATEIIHLPFVYYWLFKKSLRKAGFNGKIKMLGVTDLLAMIFT